MGFNPLLAAKKKAEQSGTDMKTELKAQAPRPAQRASNIPSGRGNTSAGNRGFGNNRQSLLSLMMLLSALRSVKNLTQVKSNRLTKNSLQVRKQNIAVILKLKWKILHLSSLIMARINSSRMVLII